MPFDLIAFGEATPGTGTPNVAPAANEDLYKIGTDTLTMTKKVNSLLGFYAWAVATGGYTSVRQTDNKIDHRFIKCAGPAGEIHAPSQGYTHFFGRPLPIHADLLEVLINNAGDEDALIGLLVGNGAIPQSSLDQVRPTHSIRGISDTAVTAFTWTRAPVTWDENLPPGSYVPVGMRCAVYKSGAAQPALARLIVPANTNWRPGVVCTEAQADKLEVQELHQLLCGEWPLMQELKFPYDAPPNLEICGSEASTDWLVELQLQKVA